MFDVEQISVLWLQQLIKNGFTQKVWIGRIKTNKFGLDY